MLHGTRTRSGAFYLLRRNEQDKIWSWTRGRPSTAGWASEELDTVSTALTEYRSGHRCQTRQRGVVL